MNAPPDSARCGRYRIVAQREGSLREAENGAVALFAEDRYLVVLDEGAEAGVLHGALEVPVGGREGRLRFGNYIGRAELGGRRLEVGSRRLDPAAAAGMLDEVSRWFSSLPFAKQAPVGAAYAVGRRQSPPVLYHAFAVLRDAFRSLGPHDLRGAFGRVLADPHEVLQPDAPRLVPIGAASGIDADTLDAIPSTPGVLRPAAPGSRMARSAVARQLQGMVPELVKVRPFLHSTDTAENRFLVGFLETMLDLLARFERLAASDRAPASAANAREAREVADFLARCRHHPALAGLEPRREVPLQSTTLRSRPGYRELLRLYYELLGRLQIGEPHDLQRLLESRNAAEVYEYWCYVRVVTALERLLGPPSSRSRFEASGFQADLRWGYRVAWPGLEVSYNENFPRPAAAGHRAGRDSYSLPLRPDIVLRSAGGRLTLFDAKLKRNFKGVVVDRPGSGEDTFKPEDLHKMHAYRDALGAHSVWVLYPGETAKLQGYPAPGGTEGQPGAHFAGVGAVALRPGVAGDGELESLLAALVGADGQS